MARWRLNKSSKVMAREGKESRDMGLKKNKDRKGGQKGMGRKAYYC